jgi:branched-chain amino acid transport system permease protein
VTAFEQYTIIGIAFGCIYALVACGVVVTYTTSGVFNFAHGAMAMFGAYTYWQMTVAWNWPPLAALVVLLGIAAPLAGIVIERFLTRRLRDAPVDLSIVVTLGLLLMLIGLATFIWDPKKIRQLAPFFNGHTVKIFGYYAEYHSIIVIVTTVLISVALWAFFVFTRPGIAMRAVVDNPDLVAMAGGTPLRIQRLSWMLSCSLAALSGVLIAPIQQLTIGQLTLFVIAGYGAAIFGRLRSLPLTMLGGLLLGLVYEYSVGYLPNNPTLFQDIKLVVPQILLFIVLILLPPDRLRTSTLSSQRAPEPAGLVPSLVWGVIFVVGAAVVSGSLGGTSLFYLSEGLAIGLVLLSLVLLTGYSGLTSLSQMTFAGIGAFVMGHYGKGGSLLGVLAAIAITAVVGGVVVAFTLRLRGLYLALATLAFAVIADEAFFAHELGSGGILNVPRLHIPGLPRSDRAYFIEMAVVFVIACIGLLALRRGRYGRRLAAFDDSPAACATLGVNVAWTKLAVFAAAAGLAGLGGALYEGVPGALTPTDVQLLQSLVILMLARVGGITTMSGAVIGAIGFGVLYILPVHYPNLSGIAYFAPGFLALFLGRFPNGIGGFVAQGCDRVSALWRRRGDVGMVVPETETEPERSPVHV